MNLKCIVLSALLVSAHTLTADNLGCSSGSPCLNPVSATNMSGNWDDGSVIWRISSSNGSISGNVTVPSIAAGCPTVTYTVSGSLSPSPTNDQVQGSTSFVWTATNPVPSTACGGYVPASVQTYRGSFANNGNDVGSGTWSRTTPDNTTLTGTFRATKSSVVPSTETTTGVGFGLGSLSTVAQFRQTLVLSGSAFDLFRGRQVYESNGSGSTYDNCWFPGSIVPKFTNVQGSTWNVGYYSGLENVWVDDYIGWNSQQVAYYRGILMPSSFPCTAQQSQVMSIAVNAQSGAKVVYKFNVLNEQMTRYSLTITRDGVSQTTNFQQ